MTKLLKNILLTVVLACTINPLYAGSGHNHEGHGHSHAHVEISKSQAQEIARLKLSKVLQSKKIDQSWSKAQLISTKIKKFQYSREWVIEFQNTKIENKEEQIIYVFVSLSGEVTGANYTGE